MEVSPIVRVDRVGKWESSVEMQSTGTLYVIYLLTNNSSKVSSRSMGKDESSTLIADSESKLERAKRGGERQNLEGVHDMKAM